MLVFKTTGQVSLKVHQPTEETSTSIKDADNKFRMYTGYDHREPVKRKRKIDVVNKFGQFTWKNSCRCDGV